MNWAHSGPSRGSMMCNFHWESKSAGEEEQVRIQVILLRGPGNSRHGVRLGGQEVVNFPKVGRQRHISPTWWNHIKDPHL